MRAGKISGFESNGCADDSGRSCAFPLPRRFIMTSLPPTLAAIALALGMTGAVYGQETGAAPQPSPPRASLIDDAGWDEEEDSFDAEPVSFLESIFEQPAEPLAPAPSSATRGRRYRGNRSSLLSSQSPINRLANSPNMFGDLTSTAGQLRYTSALKSQTIDLPLAGGSRRLKVSENNKPIPMDRVFFSYSHFEGAINVQPNLIDPTANQALPIDRYIVGAEKTFFDGWSSIEVRMPITSGVDVRNANGLDLRTSSAGNLSFNLKQLLGISDNFAWAAGLGVELPTGGDVQGDTDNDVRFLVRNQAVHLLPYLGFLATPGQSTFVQGYVQFDFACNGNEVIVDRTTPQLWGVLTEQNLVHLDLQGGVWLYSDLDAANLTGLAALVELHYVSTIQQADVIHGTVIPNHEYSFGNHFGGLDLLNLTAGLHAELWQNTTVRVGAVVPLRAFPDRFFDNELQVSVNRYW